MWRVTCWRYQAAALPEARYPKRPTPIGDTPTHHFPASRLNPGPVLSISPFAPVGNTEILFFSAVSEEV